MSILTKDWNIEVIVGNQGRGEIPGYPASPGHWVTQIVSPGTWVLQDTGSYSDSSASTSGPKRRFATHEELRKLWPWIVSDCGMQKKILEGIRTTAVAGYVLYVLDSTGYIAIVDISDSGYSGIGYCVVSGSPGNITPFPNPQYDPGYFYDGQIPGCP